MIKTIYKKHKDIVEICTHIEQMNERKQSIFKNVLIKKGKILIESQISEEYKRKIQENEDYYKDQEQSWESSNLSKEEFITLLLQKLKPVELFVKSQTKKNKSPFLKHKGFKMIDFIKENTELYQRKANLIKEMFDIQTNKELIEQENYLYQIETAQSQDNNNEYNEKVRDYIMYYKRNCRIVSAKIKLLKSCLSNISKTIQFLNVPSHIKKDISKMDNNNNHPMQTCRNIKDNNNHLNKENYTFDVALTKAEMTQKLDNFMDFTFLINNLQSSNNQLNKIKEPTTNSINSSKYDDLFIRTVNFNNVTCGWDVSCIDKIKEAKKI